MADTGLLFRLQLLNVRVALRGGLGESRRGLVERVLEIRSGGLQVRDHGLASLVLADAGLLFRLELLELRLELRGGFRERRGGRAELVLKVTRGCLAVRDER